MLNNLKFFLILLFGISFNGYAQDVELKIQMGHIGWITSIDISQDDKYMVSASIDGSVRLWEFNTERELRSFHGHTRAVSSVCFSPDDKYISSAGYDKMVYVWDVVTGKLVYTLKGHQEGVNSVDFSSDGRYLVSAGEKILIWDMTSGKLFKSLIDYSTVYMYPGISCVRFSPDNKYIASLTVHGKVVIWDIKSGEKYDEFYISKKMDYNKQGADIFNGDFEGSDFTDPIRMTDSTRMERLASIMIKLTKEFPEQKPKVHISSSLYDITNLFTNNSLAFTPDSRFIIAGDTILIRKELESGKMIEINAIQYNRPINSITVSPDGKLVFLSKWQKCAIVSMKDESLDLLYNLDTRSSVLKHCNTQLCFLSGGFNGDIGAYIYNEDMISLLKHFYPYANPVGYTSFNYNGTLIACGMNFWDKTVRIWNLEKAEEVAIIEIDRETNDKITHIEFAPYDIFNILLVTTDSKPELTNVGPRGGEGKMHFFISENEIDWMQIKKITIPDGIYGASFNPDPNTMECAVAGGLGNIFILDYMKGEKKKELIGHEEWITALKYSNPNNIFSGTFLPKNIEANNLGGEIKIWSLENEKPVIEYEAPDRKGIYSIDMSQRGQLIAGGNPDIFVYIINYNLMKPLSGHSLKVNSLDCSPNDQWLVSGSDDQSIRIWDLESTECIHYMPVHHSKVNSVQFSPDNKFIISASNDGTVKLIDPIKGEEIVTFVSTEYPVLNENMEYELIRSSIVVTPDNYYMSPGGKPAGVHFVQGLKTYSFEQFDLKYNRPDIILKRIGLASEDLVNAYYKAYQKRLSKLNFTEEMLSADWHIPEITLDNKNLIPGITTHEELVLELNASDNKYFLDRINVWVNNIPVFGNSGIDLRKEETKSVRKSINLILSQGNNKIEVSTLNQKGAESFKETIWISCNKLQVKPDLYIVGIGVSEYEDKTMNLDFAAKDAADLTNLFASRHNEFENIHILKLLNQEVTRESIKEFKEILMQSNVDDMVILFIAGHGLLDENMDYYLATYNMDFSNPSVNGLPYDDLENLLDGIPARKKLMLIDACHSGEVDKEEELFIAEADIKDENVVFRGAKTVFSKNVTNISFTNSFELMKELFTDLRRGTGAIVISSAGGGEFAYEGKQWHNGVFTYSVLDGLQSGNADKNKDGIVVVSELRDYVMVKVQELTDGRQNPTSRRNNLQFDYRVW